MTINISPSSGPAIHSGRMTRTLMIYTIIALIPVCVGAIWVHGTEAAVLLTVALITAVVCDTFFDPQNAHDGSAAIIGIIFALLLPVTAPWWIAAIGTAIAVLIGKQIFGGIGKNLFNPAALGYVLLMGLFPTYFFGPLWEVDAISLATPLTKGPDALQPLFSDLLFGKQTVTLGEAVPLTVVAGGLLLIALRTVNWRIPLIFLATISFLALVLPASDYTSGHTPWLEGNPLLHLLSGGTLLAAFFMMSDPVTTPFKLNGRMVFCVLAATYTMLIRYYTPFTDGVAIGILLANATTPLIDRITLGKFLSVSKKTN
ncbi:MAG: hypothetical protein DRR19_13925 [Candidatus Parabeggiatoa sp. nov. 1]|nr:MAG: hypothetical protein DRR19_13925 [Gammaproteobacteria bacterium]